MTDPTTGPRALGRKRLNSAGDVREELSRVYRALVQGKITPQQNGAMVNTLSHLIRAMEIEKIETRLEALESAMTKGGR